MKERLHVQEWISVGLVIGLIGSFAAISWISGVRVEKRFDALEKEISAAPSIKIELLGAVERPGIYDFHPGISLKEILKEVALKPEADRRRVKNRTIFYDSQKVEIPYKKSVVKKGKQKNS